MAFGSLKLMQVERVNIVASALIKSAKPFQTDGMSAITIIVI